MHVIPPDFNVLIIFNPEDGGSTFLSILYLLIITGTKNPRGLWSPPARASPYVLKHPQSVPDTRFSQRRGTV
jgi:hypothetical protein